MTVERLRQFCRALPGVTEDVKWGSDLCFSVSGKMFVVTNLEPPHSIAFKCTPEEFGELVERPGMIPAPYMARNMWVQEQALGETLERPELEALVRASYGLVVDKLPRSRQPGVAKPREKGRAHAQGGRSRAAAGQRPKRAVRRPRASRRRR